MSTDLIGTKQTLQTCQLDKVSAQNNFNTCQNQINMITNLTMLSGLTANLTIIDLQANLTQIWANFNALANNTAKSQCCIYINQTYANYSIQSNKIICLSTGERNVTCT